MKYTSCFVGIPLPKELKDHFSALSAAVKGIFPDIELADTSSPHLTIYYLDQKSQKDIDRISKIVEKSVNLNAGFCLRVGGMGIFDIQKPRVLYLGVEFGSEIVALKDTLAQDLDKYSAEDNRLVFTPHITIGRIPAGSRGEFLKQKEKLESIFQSIEWSFDVNKVSIFGVDSMIHPEKQEKLLDINF